MLKIGPHWARSNIRWARWCTANLGCSPLVRTCVSVKLNQNTPCSSVMRSHRRDADLAWQLSVPIYHPTTTLVMVVYGEAGRGKITFLGKLHYRISYLMYLNHR